MYPLSVEGVSTPSSHKQKKTIDTVQSIGTPLMSALEARQTFLAASAERTIQRTRRAGVLCDQLSETTRAKQSNATVFAASRVQALRASSLRENPEIGVKAP
jgi:hypothetical protein